MIASLSGTLLRKFAGGVIIDVSGVGYRVLVPDRTQHKFGPKGAQVFLWTYLNIREDAHLLFGFESWEEREVFSVLIGVSGIGPKTALVMLSELTIQELVQALQTENINLLTSVNGIGTKTAQRLIVELRDKLSLADSRDFLPEPDYSAKRSGAKLPEVVEALMTLGYPQIVSARAGQAAVQDLGEDASVQDLIKAALKHCTNLEV